jgi:hypothetical protein
MTLPSTSGRTTPEAGRTRMSLGDRILMRMFGRPEGLPGRLGGIVLARTNRKFAEEMVAFLNIEASEKILEVGARSRDRAARERGARGNRRGDRSFKGDGRAGGGAERRGDPDRERCHAAWQRGQYAIRGRCLRYDQLDAGLASCEYATARDPTGLEHWRQGRARLHAQFAAAKVRGTGAAVVRGLRRCAPRGVARRLLRRGPKASMTRASHGCDATPAPRALHGRM